MYLLVPILFMLMLISLIFGLMGWRDSEEKQQTQVLDPKDSEIKELKATIKKYEDSFSYREMLK